jgi:hypothetical protein
MQSNAWSMRVADLCWCLVQSQSAVTAPRVLRNLKKSMYVDTHDRVL